MLPGSPAVDAGLSSAAVGLNFDQRGTSFARGAGDAVDVGAVEVAGGTLPVNAGHRTFTGAFPAPTGTVEIAFTASSGGRFQVSLQVDGAANPRFTLLDSGANPLSHAVTGGGPANAGPLVNGQTGVVDDRPQRQRDAL